MLNRRRRTNVNQHSPTCRREPGWRYDPVTLGRTEQQTSRDNATDKYRILSPRRSTFLAVEVPKPKAEALSTATYVELRG